MNDIFIVIQTTNIDESIPNRVNLCLRDEPELLYLIHRLQKNGLTNIILATTTDIRDDIFTAMAEECKVDLYRGKYSDVVGRLVGSCEKWKANDFVRVNGNYPLVDIGLLKDLYRKHKEGGYDYSYNEHLKGVLWGMGCEVFNVAFLKELQQTRLTEAQNQTIGIYIRQNQSRYNVLEYQVYPTKRPSFKLNLETIKDYDIINEVATNIDEISCESVSGYLSRHPIIAKYNLEARPKEAGLEKLFLNLEKVEHIVNRKKPDLSYPISVEMTLTNACNMNCVYCSDAMLRKRQGVREMISLEDFKRLFSDLAKGGTKGIVIEGGGEPTMYSKFTEVVGYAAESGLAVGLITNGSKRIPEETIKKFEWVRVSLDASTPEEYKALKGVDFYEKVIDNIAYYTQYCKTVGVGYVVTSQNISRIEPLVMRLRELKVSYIQLRPVVDNDELYPRDIDLSYLKFYMTREFGVQVDGMEDNARGGNHDLPCYASSLTSIISGDGSVYICGRLNVYDWLKPIGNITKQSFHDIWHGEERKRQIEMISDAEFCRENCPQCRVSKFNVLFDKVYGITSVHFI